MQHNISFWISFVLLLAFQSTVYGQKSTLDTLGISNGSVHIVGTAPYTNFVKKFKDGDNLEIHIWYNPTSSSKSRKEVKAGKDEVYLLYGRNLRTGLSEMDFKLGTNARKAFSKKKERELTELIDFFEFDVFTGQHFNGALAMEALLERLE